MRKALAILGIIFALYWGYGWLTEPSAGTVRVRFNNSTEDTDRRIWFVVIIVAFILYQKYKSKQHGERVVYGKEEGEKAIARHIKQKSSTRPKPFVWKEIDSHSPADLIARWTSPSSRRPDVIWYIQVKSSLDGDAGMAERLERQALWNLCARDSGIGAIPVVALNHNSGEDRADREFEFYSIDQNLKTHAIDIP